MRSEGLLVVKPDPTDARRQLYSLVPAIPVVTTESGQVINFGFCMVRL